MNLGPLDYALIVVAAIAVAAAVFRSRQPALVQTHFDATIHDLMGVAFRELANASDDDKLAFVTSAARQFWIVRRFGFTDEQIHYAASVALKMVRKQEQDANREQ